MRHVVSRPRGKRSDFSIMRQLTAQLERAGKAALVKLGQFGHSTSAECENLRIALGRARHYLDELPPEPEEPVITDEEGGDAE